MSGTLETISYGSASFSVSRSFSISPSTRRNTPHSSSLHRRSAATTRCLKLPGLSAMSSPSTYRTSRMSLTQERLTPTRFTTWSVSTRSRLSAWVSKPKGNFCLRKWRKSRLLSQTLTPQKRNIASSAQLKPQRNFPQK